MQFEKTTLPCLRWLAKESRVQEQTQEIRLDDTMPDIGRVICAWGEILIRGKEWHTGNAGISGGIMSWVLYLPEDGSPAQCVETWIPFQTSWDFPDAGRDGTILANCVLHSVDARSISARKLIIRANVGISGEAIINDEEELYVPADVPQDVQILKETYPMTVACEAGEKAFSIEDELTLPASAKPIEKIFRYELRPEIIDKKVVAGKAVFRGLCILRLLYRSEDGSICSWDFEVPFSQFSDLDREYVSEADLVVTMALTNLEVDLISEHSLRLILGLSGQYIVYDRVNVTLAADAYSPNRKVTPEMTTLLLPSVLELGQDSSHVECTVSANAQKILDVAMYKNQMFMAKKEGKTEVNLSGVMQILCYDEENTLQCLTSKFENEWYLPAASDSIISTAIYQSGTPRISDGNGNASVTTDVLLRRVVTASRGVPMMTGFELGDLVKTEHPSIILQRRGKYSLWDIAKHTGSTTDAIMDANHLQADPPEEQMLIIPIL